MSDIGRKGLGEQVQEKVTPDSQKSYTENASENISGTYDKAASALQPDSEKSTTQKMGDNTRSGADSAQNDGKGIVQSAQETASSVAGAAADNLKAASDYVSGKTNEATSS